MIKYRWLPFAGFLVWLGVFANAQQAKPVQIADGFRYPSDVAVHSSGAVFVADSGNGRVVQIDGTGRSVVVQDLPVQGLKNDFGAGGPMSIGFVNSDYLAIGSAGEEAGKDFVGLYDLSQGPENWPLESSLFQRSLKGSDQMAAEGDFVSMAIHREYIYVVSRGDLSAGWINSFQISIEEIKSDQGTSLQLKPGLFKRFIKATELTGVNYPAALTISPDGYLVAGIRADGEPPSALAFFDQESGDLRAQFDLDQAGLVALAYGPNRGRLFGLVDSLDPNQPSGLFKLVARRRNTECELQLICEIERPAAMAFGVTGDLYVVSGGKSGILSTISGLDVPDSDPSSPEGQRR